MCVLVRDVCVCVCVCVCVFLPEIFEVTVSDLFIQETTQSTHELFSAGKTSHKHDNTSPEFPTITYTRHASKYKLHKLHRRYALEKPQLHSPWRQQIAFST